MEIFNFFGGVSGAMVKKMWIWDNFGQKMSKMQKLELKISTFSVVISGAMVEKKRDFGTFAKNFPGYPSRILSPKLKSQKHRGGTSKMSFFEKCKNRTKSQKHRGGTSKMSFLENLWQKSSSFWKFWHLYFFEVKIGPIEFSLLILICLESMLGWAGVILFTLTACKNLF